ncbi:hypothetical protein AWB69_09174 [Caballeronia udeis]|uniref:Uncharacterized protein n=1 Tax=Caballeronia udeis TaxID=1232866 RepID=A0A158JZP9_9BURK|nr:hypothetical protein [Caballeronia udeis]SAL74357.1 hypothetical protein AWB69_09174 [Caballeronia udeis]
MNPRLLYINGEWTEAGGGDCRDVIDPDEYTDLKHAYINFEPKAMGWF